MKIIIAALAAAAAISSLTATAVQAQPYGPPPGYWHRHHGWRHYGPPPHRVCFWRYGHRVCRWVR